MTLKNRKIKSLSLDLVSLCREGVNQYSFIKFFKSKNKEKNMDENQSLSITIDEEKLTKSIVNALSETISDDNKVTQLEKSLSNVFKEEFNVLKDKLETLEKSRQEEMEESVELGGQTFFKSKVGCEAFTALRKSAEELKQKDLEIEKAKYEVKAETDYPNVSGTKEEKGAFLFEIEKSLSEQGQKYAKGLLEIANNISKSMQEQTKIDDFNDNDNSIDNLNRQAEELAKSKGISKSQAYVELARSLGNAFYEGGK